MIEIQAEPEHIAISKSKGIQIDWKDGHHSQYSLRYLRDECPCASCTGAHGTEPQKTNYSEPPSSPFQMFKPALKMLNVEAVGHYAIKIDWSDGHNTGIYSFDHLRKICACAECKAQVKTSVRRNACLTLALLLLAVAVQAAPKTKLVVAIIVDQFRYDYMTRFDGDYHDGLRQAARFGRILHRRARGAFSDGNGGGACRVPHRFHSRD